MPDSDRTTDILKPPPNPCNIEATKRYVFNETGNIMLSTTDIASDTIQQEVRSVFAEVAVFFAAMTKAITTTVNPDAGVDKAGRPQYYSIYNLNALQAVIDGSGCFIQVCEEDVKYSTKSGGISFSQDLVQAVLGLACGAGELSFANAVVNSIGKEGLNISSQKVENKSRVSNIIFVCEYLLGMPVVSAIVVSADSSKVSEVFSAGPCLKTDIEKVTLTMHKDTYMFVTPSFIKQFAGDLDAGIKDPAFLTLINSLQLLVSRAPTVEGVYDVTDPGKTKQATGTLYTTGVNYFLYGEFLGDERGTLSLLPADDATKAGVTITVGSWSSTGIGFSLTYKGAAPTAPLTIQVKLPDKKGKDAKGKDAIFPGATFAVPGSYAIAMDAGKVTTIDGVYTAADAKTQVTESLAPGTDYYLCGNNFGTTGTLAFDPSTSGLTIPPSTWSNSSVKFTVTNSSGADSAAVAIKVTPTGCSSGVSSTGKFVITHT